MTFDEVIEQAIEMLRHRGRLTYRTLKRQFALDDEALEDLKFELIEGQEVAVDKDGKMLVWAGGATARETENRGSGETEPRQTSPSVPPSNDELRTVQYPTPNAQSSAERRQLTVMFCDLVGSTTLSEHLDPEEYHEVVSRYQETCTTVIKRYVGHIAQHLGDGLLAYFGYPVAHEDDAQRAVRTGLEILAELLSLNTRLPSAINVQLPHPLQVRIGVHTGLVVIGEIGSSEKREILAMGETPNIAARVQGLAEPDTVVMSTVTHRLVQGLFECQDLGLQTLKGISTPLALYRVIGEGAAQSRFEVAVGTGLTPLVGREEELTLLQRCWARAKDGAGQVVLVSGEPGIGKSRLVQEIKEQVSAEGVTRIEFRGSPYHQNSALYPIIDHLQRLLQFAREDSPAMKLEKLRQKLSHYRFPQADTLPLLAALLSLPHPEGFPPLTVSPQKQKEKTQVALVAWLLEEAENAAAFCAWEDLHWADPSTLEVLTLLLDQVPTIRLLAVLTFRPEFVPPWGNRSHLSQLTVSRLGRTQVEAMVENVTGENALPPPVVQEIVAKTDGVPLFVEELTKSVIESGGAKHVSSLQLAIPATLQDSLMARLDRLNTAKEIAQLGATIGREFSYELLYAVFSLDESSLQQGLRQLVETELVFQRGVPPQANYLFKHALVQDTAYQSLLKSRRQQLHQQVAQVLEEQFPETVETQPELVAHHYAEAGLIEQAIPYWQRAGERATQRSAYVEAINHLTKGLAVLKGLPDTPERTQQELVLHLALHTPLIATTGYSAPEVEKVVTRARELSQQVGETPQLLPVLGGLWLFYYNRGELRTAHQLGEQFSKLVNSLQNPDFFIWPHVQSGTLLFRFGELDQALEHLEESLALYNPEKHLPHISHTDHDVKMAIFIYMAWTLWVLGYPDQALKRGGEALSWARELSHPHTLAYVLNTFAYVHAWRGERQAAQELAEAAITLSTEQGFTFWVATGTITQGWALAMQGQVEEGVRRVRQGLAAYRAAGNETHIPYFFALLAEAYREGGQSDEGVSALDQAFESVQKTGERWYEAELYRLKGELLLTQEGSRPQAGDHKGKTEEAEECFLKAVNIARRQQAKSLELRAATSLARLWQQQGKKIEAHKLLSDVYNWFTEGFDTKDLQEAKALLEELH